MAVPKQKQSHSRSTKRRSQHKAANPGTQGCPACGEPRLPHRVCKNCGSYNGRTVVNTNG
ncbi:MAG: 50S ribosomal protein L32 [Solirubrobacteraceae bacterium]|nr:50S ribosomal protein L32 [Solirubrobacteraceae bacterium]